MAQFCEVRAHSLPRMSSDRMAWRVPRQRGCTCGRPTTRAQRRRALNFSARGKTIGAERELLETLSEDAIEPLADVVERATEVLTPALGQAQRRVARRAAGSRRPCPSKRRPSTTIREPGLFALARGEHLAPPRDVALQLL